jgi:hypothetical protein
MNRHLYDAILETFCHVLQVGLDTNNPDPKESCVPGAGM